LIVKDSTPVRSCYCYSNKAPGFSLAGLSFLPKGSYDIKVFNTDSCIVNSGGW
jgi:hypothetical protein